MKKIEVGLTIISIVLAMVFLLIKNGGIFFVMSMFALASIYFYLGFAVLHPLSLRNIIKGGARNMHSSNHFILTSFTGVLISLCIIGILFKIMHWPLVTIYLLISSLGLAIITSICIYQLRTTTSKQLYNHILMRSIPYLLLGSVFLLFSIF